MFDFFRRHQKVFFVCITAMIVFSFSFFGAFGTFSRAAVADTVVCKAVDGTKVYRSELNDMVAFLATDREEQLSGHGVWGGNGLNDGVVQKDFFETGLFEVVVAPFLPRLHGEMRGRYERERRFQPYVNPQASFMSAEQVWAYFAPTLRYHLEVLKNGNERADATLFGERVRLYMAERQFPALYLKHILRMQEAQYEWLAKESDLAHRDLALFGYHSLQDWFGRPFLELVSEYIINAAKIAHTKGYTVSREEAEMSLHQVAHQSYQDARRNASLGVANANEYFREQLRMLGMDQARAVKVWRTILLFRRLFYENAEAVLVDTLPYRDFYAHLNEYVDVDLYRLPPQFRFQNMRDVEKFEVYLRAISTQSARPDLIEWNLALPTSVRTPQEVKKVYPELVERRFTVLKSAVDMPSLGAQVGVKETWEWEVDPQHWEILVAKFPELSKRGGKPYTPASDEERYSQLERLDNETRAQLDEYSRSLIVREHPEWIREALDRAPQTKEAIAVRERGGMLPFPGITNRVAFLALLDSAPLGEPSPELAEYSQDGENFFRIQVLERGEQEGEQEGGQKEGQKGEPKGEQEELVSYQQALRDGTMDALFDKAMESAYLTIREQHPTEFLQEGGQWKPYAQVKEQVADLYFAPLVRALDARIDAEKGTLGQYTDWGNQEKARCSVRLLPYLEGIYELARTNPESLANHLQPEGASPAPTGPAEWKLECSRVRVTRREENHDVDPQRAFLLRPRDMAPLSASTNAGPSFFSVVAIGVHPSDALVRDKVYEAHTLLGQSLFRCLGSRLLAEMQEKGAISLDSGTMPAEKPPVAESEPVAHE